MSLRYFYPLITAIKKRRNKNANNLLFSQRNSIQFKIQFYLTMFSLLPLLVIGIISYSTSKAAIDNKVRDYSRQSISQTAENIEFTLNSYKDSLMQIISNPNVISSLKSVLRDGDKSEKNDGSLSDLALTTKLAYYIATTQEVQTISFISPKYYLEGTYYCGDDVLKGNSSYFKKVMANNNSFTWFSTRAGTYGYQDSQKVNVFSLGKQVHNLDDMRSLNLSAIIDIREDKLSDICSKANEGNLINQCFIIDENGMIIADPDKSMLYKNISELFNRDDILKIMGKTDQISSFETKYMNESVVANSLKLKVNNWRVIDIIKKEYLYKESNGVIKIICIAAIACIIFSSVFSAFIATGISRPLKNMSKIMRKVVKGNLNEKIDLNRNGRTTEEVIVLQESYNFMISKIQELLDKVYEEQNNKRVAEIKALEAQINPHFLYNTLDAIKWTALLQKATNTAEMANMLSRLLHISLGKGNETIRLEEEIEHVQCYLGIQKFRFNFNIDVRFHIDEGTKQLKVPKIILQPIIENSILHGLADKHEGGIIDINCSILEGKVNIEIIDNGCGFDMNESGIIAKSELKSGEVFSGIGIANVEERIKLICGRQYGIKIESKIDQGTKVQISLPIME
jgi:two-component system, sensor histidine kinase YesM